MRTNAPRNWSDVTFSTSCIVYPGYKKRQKKIKINENIWRILNNNENV